MDGGRVAAALAAHDVSGLAGEGGEDHVAGALGDMARERGLAGAGIAEEAKDLGSPAFSQAATAASALPARATIASPEVYPTCSAVASGPWQQMAVQLCAVSVMKLFRHLSAGCSRRRLRTCDRRRRAVRQPPGCPQLRPATARPGGGQGNAMLGSLRLRGNRHAGYS